MSETHSPIANPANERIKFVCRRLYDAQKLRIQQDLRFQRLVRDGVMTPDDAEKLFKVAMGFEEKAEKEYERVLWSEVRELEIVERWLKRVKGIGPRLSGLLIANIAPVERFPNVAKLWAYSGLHTRDGRAVKRKRGEKANWNDELKTTCWKIAQSFVKQSDSPYRAIYDRYKARILEREVNRGNDIWGQVGSKMVIVHKGREPDGTHATAASQHPSETQHARASHSTGESQSRAASQFDSDAQGAGANQSADESQSSAVNHEWTLGRINNMALRYIAKLFLSHLWQVWREMEGLPVRDPYAVEYLGHTTVIDPWSMIVEPNRP